ncbi:AI-2E family transporter [Arenimonas sp.]|uniref:AI-2E family transporter n=1 Tax=Arenimonas sp. TaxID=1872635 RepID=UPI0035B3F75E
MARRRRGTTRAAATDAPVDAAPAPVTEPVRRRAQARPLWLLVTAALLYTCYLASSLILPIVLAGFFALLLAPLMRRAPLRWLPRAVSAVLLVAALLGGIGAVGTFLATPAADWVRKVPFVMRDAAPKLRQMVEPFNQASRARESLGSLTKEPGAPSEAVVVQPPQPDLIEAIPGVVGPVLAVILLTFSFLVFGDDVLRKLLALRPTRAQKKLTAGIVQKIQSDLSRYMLTISGTSSVLGLATMAWLWWLGVPDPLLWGVLAAGLNLTPIVGPLVMVLLLSLVGLSQFDTLGAAMLPAVGFMAFNALESQLLTPMVLGRTMRINPLAIILWLMLWGWLWGVPGLLVAVPMLVCLKIVADHVEDWKAWSQLLE